jgi:nicotinamidase/pyrazinamidase
MHPQSDALIVVDLQPDFMPGGPLAVPGGDAICAPIADYARGFETVIATQDWHPRGHASFASTHQRPPFSTVQLHGAAQTLWPDHCVQGSEGARLHPALRDAQVSLIVRKGTHPGIDSYSAFRDNVGPGGLRTTTGLEAMLRARGIERLWVVGLARDYCVAWTAIDAARAGFTVTVVDPLTRAVDAGEVARAATDAALASAGVQVAGSPS